MKCFIIKIDTCHVLSDLQAMRLHAYGLYMILNRMKYSC